jgi:hypothetical protein
MSLSVFAGMYNADQFAYGWPSSKAGVLQVTQGSTVSGAYTIVCSPTLLQTIDGINIPITTSTPIMIGSDSGLEIVTPTAVSTNNLGGLLITATFTNAHGTGAQVRSGDAGLAEAVAAASANGGGQVVVTAGWTRNGGTSAILASTTIPAGVSVTDNRGTGAGGSGIQIATVPLTLAQIQGAFTTPVQVVPAPGANSIVDVVDAVLNLVFGSAAYSGGGAAQLSYGTGVTTAATAAVWAAANFTGLSANRIDKVLGVNIVGTTLTSALLNKAVNYTNATAVFTAGTGGSGLLSVSYRIINGVS